MNKYLARLVFAAMLLIMAINPESVAQAQSQAAATLALPPISYILAGQTGTIPLTLTLTTGNNVYGADITITYDAAVASNPQVALGALTTGWSTAVNTSVAGTIKISMASATPVTSSGEFLKLTLTAVSTIRVTDGANDQPWRFERGCDYKHLNIRDA